MFNPSYIIVNELKPHHKEQLLSLFKKQSWLKDRTLQDIEAIENTCSIFTLIEKSTDTLVGFTRVLTDDVRYAYIHDVIIADELQGQGFGSYMIETILANPRFQKISCFELLCLPDKVSFYNKFNFKEQPHLRFLRYDKRFIAKD